MFVDTCLNMAQRQLSVSPAGTSVKGTLKVTAKPWSQNPVWGLREACRGSPRGLSGRAKPSLFLSQLGTFGVRVSEPGLVGGNAPRREQADVGD